MPSDIDPQEPHEDPERSPQRRDQVASTSKPDSLSSSITEDDFIAARNVAYGCLSAVHKLVVECDDIVCALKEATDECAVAGDDSLFANLFARWDIAVFTSDDLAILPADKEFSRITRAVEYLCKVLDNAAADALFQLDWNDLERPGKIGKIKDWLLLASAGPAWRGCSTAHEKAVRLAFDVWSAIDDSLTLKTPCEIRSLARGPGFCFLLEVVEEKVEKIRERIRGSNLSFSSDFRVAMAEIELESAKALAAWRAEKNEQTEETQAKPKNPPGFTSQEFNVAARDYLKKHAIEEHRVTVRQLQAHLRKLNPAGTCSTLTITGTKDCKRPGLPAWRAYQDELERDGRKGKKTKPRAVTFSETVEATTGEHDARLQRLLNEQKEDYEPSPVEEDPPDEPQHVRCHKEV